MKGNNKMILEGLNNYYKCKQCAKQFLCKECTGLVKFSQIEWGTGDAGKAGLSAPKKARRSGCQVPARLA